MALVIASKHLSEEIKSYMLIDIHGQNLRLILLFREISVIK